MNLLIFAHNPETFSKLWELDLSIISCVSCVFIWLIVIGYLVIAHKHQASVILKFKKKVKKSSIQFGPEPL